MRLSPKSEDLIQLVGKLGVARPRDLDAYGIPRAYLSRLTSRGLLERVGRGLYSIPGADMGEMHSIVEAALRVPRGVICLVSALGFHQLTTQNPHQVWVAIDVDARAPKPNGVQLRIVRFSGVALNSMIEEHEIRGVTIRVYSAAKTVADCFKFRNKIGLDVAIEALRDCWRQRKATMDEIWAAAKTCRVAEVMRPYLASLV